MSLEDQQKKKSLRRYFQAKANQFPAAQRAPASERICQLLRESSLWSKAQSVLFFAARPDEPDIWPLVDLAFREGKNIGFPRYGPDEACYHAAWVLDPARQLAPGAFGITEPVRTCPRHPLHQFDLVLVPGLAFTTECVRLGRGKGYYDRLLQEVIGATCGLAFDWQIAVEVPFEPHDIRLCYVLTPSGWHPAPARGGL